MLNKLFIFCFLLLSLALAVSAQSTTNAQAEVKRALSEYDTAWNKKDVDAVSKRMAKDYIYFNSLGGTSDRKSSLEFLASPEYKLTFVERSEIVVHSVSSSTAIVGSRWKGRGTWKNETIDDDQRCGLVFTREKGKWLLISEHCVQITAK